MVPQVHWPKLYIYFHLFIHSFIHLLLHHKVARHKTHNEMIKEHKTYEER